VEPSVRRHIQRGGPEQEQIGPAACAFALDARATHGGGRGDQLAPCGDPVPRHPMRVDLQLLRVLPHPPKGGTGVVEGIHGSHLAFREAIVHRDRHHAQPGKAARRREGPFGTARDPATSMKEKDGGGRPEGALSHWRKHIGVKLLSIDLAVDEGLGHLLRGGRCRHRKRHQTSSPCRDQNHRAASPHHATPCPCAGNRPGEGHVPSLALLLTGCAEMR
jgi:hypothetical protein